VPLIRIEPEVGSKQAADEADERGLSAPFAPQMRKNSPFEMLRLIPSGMSAVRIGEMEVLDVNHLSVCF